MRLANKVAIVTGSANGIGRAIALAFAREGAHVVVSDIDETGVQRTQHELQESLARSCALRADVTDRSQVEAMVAKAVETFGRVDILVNNAGGGGGVTGLMLTD